MDLEWYEQRCFRLRASRGRAKVLQTLRDSLQSAKLWSSRTCAPILFLRSAIQPCSSIIRVAFCITERNRKREERGRQEKRKTETETETETDREMDGWMYTHVQAYVRIRTHTRTHTDTQTHSLLASLPRPLPVSLTLSFDLSLQRSWHHVGRQLRPCGPKQNTLQRRSQTRTIPSTADAS